MYDPFFVVEHKRAPTDESIKLYKEMVEKAHAATIERFTPTGNVLNGRIVETFDILNVKNQYRILFELNGKKYDMKADVEYPVEIAQYSDVFAAELVNAVSKVIASNLLTAMAQEKFK